MGLFIPTTYGEGLLIHYHHGSVWTHHVRGRFAPLLPPWVCLDPTRTGKVRSITTTMGLSGPNTSGEGSLHHYHHGSVWTHHVRERFAHSLTPWVCLDPPRVGKFSLFTKHIGSPETHGVHNFLTVSSSPANVMARVSTLCVHVLLDNIFTYTLFKARKRC